MEYRPSIRSIGVVLWIRKRATKWGGDCWLLSGKRAGLPTKLEVVEDNFFLLWLSSPSVVDVVFSSFCFSADHCEATNDPGEVTSEIHHVLATVAQSIGEQQCESHGRRSTRQHNDGRDLN